MGLLSAIRDRLVSYFMRREIARLERENELPREELRIKTVGLAYSERLQRKRRRRRRKERKPLRG